ncbi:MAG: RecX family transcriptional regulator [Alphaproteobacteria bacterium]|nr:RecX family transcriptional regulator [Alphaproteobacteria bacterium]
MAAAMLAAPNRKDGMMTTDRSRAEQRLMNKAVHYLGRYSASRQRLREVLHRFAMRKLEAHEEVEISRAIDAVLDDCIRLGYVDDAAFALSRARNKRRSGGSTLAIRRSLAEHAIGQDLANEALAAADEATSDGELTAALRLAARRRIGPYFTRQRDDDTYRKQLASLARAGFSFATAKAVMALDNAEEADELAESLRQM